MLLCNKNENETEKCTTINSQYFSSVLGVTPELSLFYSGWPLAKNAVVHFAWFCAVEKTVSAEKALRFPVELEPLLVPGMYTDKT